MHGQTLFRHNCKLKKIADRIITLLNWQRNRVWKILVYLNNNCKSRYFSLRCRFDSLLSLTKLIFSSFKSKFKMNQIQFRANGNTEVPEVMKMWVTGGSRDPSLDCVYIGGNSSTDKPRRWLSPQWGHCSQTGYNVLRN